MRIVWISHTGQFGGAELALVEGARGLMAQGMEVHVALPSEGELTDHLRMLGVPVHVTPYPWWVGAGIPALLRVRRTIDGIRHARRLARLLDEVGADVVVTNTLAVATGAIAARMLRIPHVWYIHEFGYRDHGLRFDLGEALSCRMIDHLSDRVVVNSRAVQIHFRRWITAEKMRIARYAVELAQEPQRWRQNDRIFRLVLVGKKAPGKRQEDAVRALALLRRQGLNTALSLVGGEDAAYGNFLRALAQRLQVEADVEFAPFGDPIPYFANSDVALMCSSREAFGRVTVEAMKVGIPVIGADTGGTAELIRHGWNGLLFQAGSAEDLARKVEQLYHDRALLRTLAENGKSWARHTFTLERYTSDLSAVLQHLDSREECARDGP